MIGTWTTICSGIVAIVIILAWYTSPKYTSSEPPRIPHTIPLIGHLLPFSRDRRSLFTRFSNQSNHGPYSMYIAGRKHYVFSKPNEYAAVYRNSRTLDTGNFVKLLMVKWFGYTMAEADNYKSLKGDFEEIHTNLLLRENNNRPTAIKYFTLLEEQLCALDTELDKSVDGKLTKDCLELVADVLGVASTRAYFGRKLFEGNPNILQDLIKFNKYGFWSLLLSAPKFLYPKAYKAKDNILEAFQELSDTMDAQDDVSDFMRARQKLINTKMSSQSQAPDKFNIFFGLNANSIPNSYCALLELLTIPNLVSEIRAELVSANYPSLPASEYITIIPSKLPLLQSFYYESLRMHLNAVQFREVMAPTTLTTDRGEWKLEKGGVVTLAGTLLHADEEFHPCPDEFRPKRFMDRGLGGGGENAAKLTRPFGGGTSYCPGRVFAEKQIMGFLAAMVWRYEMRVMKEEGWVVTRNSDLEVVAAQPPVLIEIRKREGV